MRTPSPYQIQKRKWEEENYPETEFYLRKFAISGNRIYALRFNGLKDVTHMNSFVLDGYRYNPRRIAYFLINGQWPGKSFTLPWE